MAVRGLRSTKTLLRPGQSRKIIRHDETECGHGGVYFLKVCKIYCCLKGHCLVPPSSWEL